MKISATIITLNEQNNISRCLESLQDVVEEIIIVDSFSTDKTEQVCQKYNNVTFVKQKFLGYTKQKNFAAQLTKNNYVLNIDADEYLSEKLKQSIIRLKQTENLKAGYRIKRLNNFWGHWVKVCGLYPDRQLRLYNKSLGEFDGEFVHEKVTFKTSQKIGMLRGDLLHLSFVSKQKFTQQLQKYAELKAQEYKVRGKRISYFTIIIKTLWRFLRDYIFLLGFTLGRLGLFICLSYAQYEYNKYMIAKKG